MKIVWLEHKLIVIFYSIEIYVPKTDLLNFYLVIDKKCSAVQKKNSLFYTQTRVGFWE